MLKMSGMVKWVVIRFCCLICEEGVSAAIKGLKIRKAASPTGVVSEMMKTSCGVGTRWMPDLMNNIVKEACFPDDWRKRFLQTY